MRIAMGTLALLAAVVCTQAAGQDYPKLKPGLWEMERSAGGGPPQLNKMTMCLDATVQKQMFEMGAGTMQGLSLIHI